MSELNGKYEVQVFIMGNDGGAASAIHYDAEVKFSEGERWLIVVDEDGDSYLYSAHTVAEIRVLNDSERE